jgi:putative ABC transport system permease protein
VLTWRITLPELKYEEADRRRQFVDRVLERVRAIPGITDVAVANVLPASGSNTSRAVVPEGHVLKDPRNPPLADYRTVSPDYFRTLRIPILRGRPLDRMDTKDGVAVAIVSQALADRHWPGQDPIGRRLRVGVENPTLLTIVGVAGDVVHHWFGRRNAPTLYRPFAQDPRLGIAVAARTASDPAGFTAAARTTVLAIDPTQPIHEVRTMRRHVLDSTIGLQYIAVLMGVFGAIAVVLASVGVYAVMSCLVAQRTHEFGVRLALGATARDVVRLSVGQVGRLTVAGLGLGLVLAAGLARVMASALFGVVTTDVRTFVAGAATLGTVALLAGYIPARRAAAVDAVRALASQ